MLTLPARRVSLLAAINKHRTFLSLIWATGEATAAGCHSPMICIGKDEDEDVQVLHGVTHGRSAAQLLYS